MIIDTHAHLHSKPKGLDKVAESGEIEQVWLMHIAHRRSGPPEHASEKEVLDVARRYPGFFIPFGFIDYPKGPQEIDRMKDAGFVGLKAILPPKPYDDPEYLPIYERADALKMPILFHVGVIKKSTREELPDVKSLGPTNMRPSMLDGIAAAFPKLPLIAGHMGLPWINELFESLWYYPNIYCALCGYVDFRWLMDNLDRRPWPGKNGESYCDRMMFATDNGYGREEGVKEAVSYANFWEEFFRRAGRSHQWGTKVEAVLHGNARKILPAGRRKLK